MLNSRSVLKLLPTTLAVFAVGCAVGPNFKTPPAPSVERYTTAPLPEKTAETATPGGEAQVFLSGKDVPAQWWRQFGSEKLNQLVREALAANPSVASAQAALRQAQENLRAQTSTLFPTFDAKFSGTRQKIDTASFGNPGGGGTIYNLYNASVGVSYGLDIWGGTRRGVEAQAAAVDFQRYQLEATYQTLIANVVTAAIREAQQRQLIALETGIIADQERLLKITERQFNTGGVGRADVLSAQSNLATERAKLPALNLQLTQAQNQLSFYLGKLPSERASSDFDLAELQLPKELPIALPSTLVRQRPDIRAAEAQLHEASANIGVATANLLPQVTITGSIGTQATTIDKLFSNNIFSLAGGVTQPLFHAGELTAKRRAAIAAYDKTAADYRLAVLTAFQNVADTLGALTTDAEALQAQRAASDAAEASLRLTEKQYQLGGTSFLTLLNAQMVYSQVQTSYVQSLATRYQDTTALFQALGGGWTQRDPHDTSPAGAP
jgi:NodT family efflux transporter outer membrane factor (OMF) lipoprotein